MVFELLRKGAKNARPGRELADILGVTRRRLVSIIEKERRSGFLICAETQGNKAGYYIPESKEELEAYARTLAKRAMEIDNIRGLLLSSPAVAELPEKCENATSREQ